MARVSNLSHTAASVIGSAQKQPQSAMGAQQCRPRLGMMPTRLVEV